MTTIRRSGLTLTNPEGHWITEDGEWEIARYHSTSYCDGPHPTRYDGYCWGNNEHDAIIGWGIQGAKSGITPMEIDDVYQTRDEAIAALSAYLNSAHRMRIFRPEESVICPKCRVPVGEPCLTSDNRIAVRTHKARFDAAMRANTQRLQ